MDEEGFVVFFGEHGFVVGAEVVAVLDVGAHGLELLDGVGVVHADEAALGDFLEGFDLALQEFEVGAAFAEDAFDHVDDEVFLELEVLLPVHVGGFGFEHPELGEVAAGLGLFGAEGGAEAVGAAEGGGGGFEVELAGLGEVGFVVEVLHFEEVAGALDGVGGEDGRIGQHESPVLHELAEAVGDLVADAKDGLLAGGAEPEVAVVEEEFGAVFLFADGELGGDSDDGDLGGSELDAGFGAVVGFD